MTAEVKFLTNFRCCKFFSFGSCGQNIWSNLIILTSKDAQLKVRKSQEITAPKINSLNRENKKMYRGADLAPPA